MKEEGHGVYFLSRIISPVKKKQIDIVCRITQFVLTERISDRPFACWMLPDGSDTSLEVTSLWIQLAISFETYITMKDED